MLNGKAKSRVLIESQGGRRKAEGGVPATASPFPLPPSAFTLTELLVVIAIIAILASLITAAAVNAMAARNRTVILVEIGQLADAVERFKTNTGGAYPPNAMNTYPSDPDPNNFKGDPINTVVVNDFIRSFQKAFPRHKEPDGLLRRLAGQTGNLTAGNPSELEDANGNNTGGGMNAAEAIYFWLGGFSADPIRPITGEGGPSFAETNSPSGLDPADEILENRAPIYEFDLTRLGPRDDDGLFDGRFVTYSIDLNNDGDVTDAGEFRRINLWTYQPKGFEKSFVYFDASRHDPMTYDRDLSGVLEAKIYALKKIREGFSSSGTPEPRDIDFVNKGKYQILHPGLDDEWGTWQPFSITNASATDASPVIVYPTGPFTGEVADTLTNFSGGTLESAQE
jgi:prepilin-type N-terminal cleavage/methylation domain-containing protein